MFKAELEVVYESGASGAKVLYADSSAQAMDEACAFIRDLDVGADIMGTPSIVKWKVMVCKEGVEW
tara:strand:- start:1147 stop:1344 length:198 start_codon:yes stop_codon:yes gene_type:complete